MPECAALLYDALAALDVGRSIPRILNGSERDSMSDQPPILNVDEAIARMGDRDIYLEISQLFAGQLPHSLDDIDRALAGGEIDDAARLAHSMKSNCATVGADELRERCYALELLCRSGNIDASRRAFAECRDELASLAPTLLAMR
jgi:HPt (histidine-containing phosphotransfer) domain-containing protein